MTKEELEKRAKEYARKEVYYGAYVDEEVGMEIAEEAYIEATERETKMLQKRNEELEAQIEDFKKYCCEVSKYLHDYSGSGVELNSPECRKRDILLIKELKLCKKWGDLR